MAQRGHPAGSDRLPDVDVVIPLRPGDHASIVHCLAGLASQTVAPRQVVLVDDGGAEADHSLQLAREFARANGLRLERIARRWSIGHVVTLKRQARESSAQVLLVLQPTTVLESPGYLAACVAALDETMGVACACGRAAVLWPSQRRQVAQSGPFRRWVGDDPYLDPLARPGPGTRVGRWLATAVTAHFLDLGVLLCDRISMRACGGILQATGGAVAYRRRYLQDLFDRVEPVRGDDLGAWPAHAIAHALATEGYRPVRLETVVARVQPPPLSRWPRLAWRWLLGCLQAGHWFDPLLRSPFRALATRRWRTEPKPPPGSERRRETDAFREPFGERITRLQGRPLGGYLLLRAVLLGGASGLAWMLVVTGAWGALGAFAVAELAVLAGLSAGVAAPGARTEAAIHALAAAPLRWGVVLAVPFALVRMAGGLWFGRGFRWRHPGVRTPDTQPEAHLDRTRRSARRY